MAEFQEVLKQKERMCSSYLKCDLCPMELLCCDDWFYKSPQQAEEIIMKWEEEHPIQTNADKFKEVFGFVFNGRNCDGVTCHEECRGIKCSECKYKDFWQQEYKEPKGE